MGRSISLERSNCRDERRRENKETAAGPIILHSQPVSANLWSTAVAFLMLPVIMRGAHYRRAFSELALLLLTLVQTGAAADGTWNKIRYQGGTITAKVNPFDWNTTVRLTSTAIQIDFASLKRVTIEGRSVIALTSGERACRRVADMVVFSPASRPLPLFGIAHTGKDRLVGIEFTNPDGSLGFILLLVQKESYRQLLQAISSLTGKAVEDAP